MHIKQTSLLKQDAKVVYTDSLKIELQNTAQQIL